MFGRNPNPLSKPWLSCLARLVAEAASKYFLYFLSAVRGQNYADLCGVD